MCDELKDLKDEGIIINVIGEDLDIFFALTLFVGDNLGVHMVYGFIECFSGNHPCRFCKTLKESIQKDSFVKPELRRTRE